MITTHYNNLPSLDWAISYVVSLSLNQSHMVVSVDSPLYNNNDHYTDIKT